MLNGNWSLLPTIPVFNRLLSEWKTNQNQINKYTAFWNHISSYEGNSHKNYSLYFFYFLLFYISFYISRYFSPAFRILFNIIWKTIFVTNLPFFNRSSQRHSHLLKNQNPLSMKEHSVYWRKLYRRAFAKILKNYYKETQLKHHQSFLCHIQIPMSIIVLRVKKT